MVGRIFLAVVLIVLAEGAVTGAWSQKVTEERASASGPLQASPDRIAFELDWDFYYTSAGLILSLTDKPIPHSDETSEFEIYRSMLTTSPLPRYLLLEASVYPMPCLGGFIKSNSSGFYDDAEAVDGLNLVKVITAGFNEPYALSVFAGNVVSFQSEGARSGTWNNSYLGYLFSFGDYHIKDNDFIYDKWYELEWKLKGDLSYRHREMSWSFRAGAKIHDHPEINDSVYLSLRRSRVDYANPADSVWQNSGFEYTFHADSETLRPISHFFSVDKKWPLPGRRMVLSIAVGFVWEANRKYLGALSREKGDDFQIFIRPNLTF